MYRRPLTLFLSSCLFLYFPAETAFRWWNGEPPTTASFVVSVVLPLVLLIGLIHVSKVFWYTLVAFIALWGVRDLYQYYASVGSSLRPLLVHLGIYCLSLSYFINPRIRHLYFDPKLRWWRTKPRYETHLPFLLRSKADWHYPILRNVSEGGCFIETTHPLDVSTPLQLVIPLPLPLGVSVIKTEGEVRWISKNPLRAGMGVQFTRSLPQHTKALRSFVARQL